MSLFLSDDQLTGPYWPFIDPHNTRGTQLLVSGVGEQKVVHSRIPEIEWYVPVPPGHETETIVNFIKTNLKEMVCLEPGLEVGQYHPRIWRVGYLHSENRFYSHPVVRLTPYFDSFVDSIERFDSLCRLLKELFSVIYPSDENKNTYGYEIRNLILLACTEVECQWRAVLEANHYPGNRFTTNDYVKLLDVMRLSEYEIVLSRYANIKVFSPFLNWNRNNPSLSLPWYNAYNELKHDAEKRLSSSTLEFAVAAVAAVFVLLVAQFGLMYVREYVDDAIFRLQDYPRWTPADWYYESRDPWTAVDFAFS